MGVIYLTESSTKQKVYSFSSLVILIVFFSKPATPLLSIFTFLNFISPTPKTVGSV